MITLIYCLGVTIGLLAAWFVWLSINPPTRERLFITVLTAMGVIAATISTTGLWLEQAGNPWNEVRLAPIVALRYGYALYQPLDVGPVLSTVVGPVAFLAYWPVSLIHASSEILILSASAMNLIVFVALTLAYLRSAGANRLEIGLGLLVAVQLALLYPALRYSLFSIHSDAPALALSTLGILIIHRSKRELPWTLAGAAALCFTLATWSKQSIAVIFPIMLLVVALHHGRQATWRFTIASMVVGVVTSLSLIAWLGFENLRMNMFSVPAHHPWVYVSLSTGTIDENIHAIGTSTRIRVLLAVMIHIVRTSWPIYALFSILLAERFIRRTTSQPWWPRSSWATLALVSVALLPTAALGRVKLGGDINHESFSVFFICLAFVIWLVGAEHIDRRGRLFKIACIIGILFTIEAPSIREHSWQPPSANQNASAYRYSRAHPGRVYFPYNPLSSLLTEGKCYHFDYGVTDRNLGGAEVTPQHLAEYLPSPRPIIASARPHQDYILNRYFTDYVLLPEYPELPGWKIYGPPLTNPRSHK